MSDTELNLEIMQIKANAKARMHIIHGYSKLQAKTDVNAVIMAVGTVFFTILSLLGITTLGSVLVTEIIAFLAGCLLVICFLFRNELDRDEKEELARFKDNF